MNSTPSSTVCFNTWFPAGSAVRGVCGNRKLRPHSNVVGLEGYSSVLLLFWVATSWPAPCNTSICDWLLVPQTIPSDPRSVGHNNPLSCICGKELKEYLCLVWGSRRCDPSFCCSAGVRDGIRTREFSVSEVQASPCVFADV